MSSFQRLRVPHDVSVLQRRRRRGAQSLGVNPSAAASDVRNPSSTNPSAAASDIRNPSATNPSAAASQIPQPSAISSRRDNVTPSKGSQRIAPQTRRARAVQQGRRERVKSRDANAGVEVTRPFEALEGARRDRIEFEKRAANDKVQQQRMEKEQKAKQAGEEREEKRGRRQARSRCSSGRHTAPSEDDSAEPCWTE